MSDRIINPNDAEFQLGRYLFDAGVIHADIKRGDKIQDERILQLCERYCRLVYLVELLRAECNRLERLTLPSEEESQFYTYLRKKFGDL
jgi:hypothetical protein